MTFSKNNDSMNTIISYKTESNYELVQKFTSGEMYYAGFTLPYITNNNMIAFETVFVSRLTGYLWADMSVDYSISWTDISYNYDPSVFLNSPIS